MGKKTTEQKNDPWAPAQPFILQGLQNSGRVFDSTQPQLEAFAGMQRDAYGRLAPGAEAGITATQDFTNRTIAGEFSGVNPGRGVYNDVAGGRSVNDFSGAVRANPAAAGMRALSDGGFVGQGAGADYFRDVVSGKFLNSNPYLNDNIGYAIDDANDASSSIFSKAGRFGSEAHQGTAMREAGRISSGMRMADLAAERDRQQAAAGSLDGLTRADRGLQLSALGQYGDASAREDAMRLQALGMDQDARAGVDADRLRAAGLLDTGFNADLDRRANAGNTAQNLMGGAQSLLNNAAELPWMGVGALNGNVRQASSGYGTQTTTENSSFGSVLGGLAGTLGGAAISKYSDERVKDVKRQVGVDPNTGLPLYDYTYKSDPAQTPQVGVMAQDVAKVAPEAVSSDPAGFMKVDYGKLGMPDPEQLAAQLPMQNMPRVKEKFSIGGLFADATRPGGAGNVGDTVSRIGEGLLAGAGGGWSDVGRSLMAARAERRTDGQFNREMDVRAANAEQLAELRAAQIAAAERRANAPPEPTAMMQNYNWLQSLPPEQRAEAMRLMPGFGNTDEGIAAAGKRAGAVAAARAPYRAPAGGRGGAPSKSPPKYVRGPNGQIMKWVP